MFIVNFFRLYFYTPKSHTSQMNKNRNPIDGANMHKSDILFVEIHESEISEKKSTAYI